MNDEAPGPEDAIKSVELNKTDSELVWMAARLLTTMDPGAVRMVETERLLQLYRDDLSDAHPSADPALLDDMTANFGGALLFRMEQLLEGTESDDQGMQNRGTPLVRIRVMEAIGHYLKMIDPRH
jgi:hypothetical protein